ncbi:MAG: exodeoxyribonuclease VII small subunit [Paludibacter sp.]|nr:exodeoxyribonuclease VII small subunit [Bacteroidales bacterium]MCM1068643.1 exodeoxyribonuclease VII small subunit [Prevotella sp.]MCM1353307.1 exodeoxyribonuclease VII small subunit [Bacteroides sp.]MCM1442285.1 exodeoxyribonuclease VII small subunit [Muribaculum sp.]MCM1481104.1 exodeoxyribonuclease VII small subunit [Paludibacter sp.]
MATQTLTYDAAIRRLETIIASLENGQALSFNDYRQRAAEAKTLLDFCQKQLLNLEEDLNAIFDETTPRNRQSEREPDKDAMD